MPMSGLPEDARERFFEKSSKKRERFQKFWKYTRCGRFFQKSGTVFRIFGNIPYVEKFFEKRVSDFGFSAYVLWWQPQKRLKEDIHEKSHDFFKGSRKKSGHSGKKLDRVKKITIFFKSGETKTGCSGDKLGRVNFFRISSKMVELNRSSRERNWTVVKNFGFLQKWW